MKKKVDIIIPVYNAPEYTRKCIDALYQHVPDLIEKLIIIDDASGAETAQMLDDLEYPKIEIHHSEVNKGYGASVNEAFSYTTTELVLVLNSDVLADNDFLSPLIAAMNANENIGVIYSVPTESDKYSDYLNSNGYVITHQLSGYAFLIRREVFIEAGMFSPMYGRGYFEDTALAREISDLGWDSGVCTRSILKHAGSKSFSKSEVDELYKKNQKTFREKYPESCRRVLILASGDCFEQLSNKAKSLIEETVRGGGKAFLATNAVEKLPNSRVERFDLKFIPLFAFIYRTIIRGYKRPYTKTTEIYIDGETRGILAAMTRFIARRYRVATN